MVTFGSKISTEGGITGKGGTIATKEARKKDEAKKKDKELANLPQYEKELPPKQNIFSKITKGIASLVPSGGGGGDRNVTIPNQDLYNKEFKIGDVEVLLYMDQNICCQNFYNKMKVHYYNLR
mgnify:CR=1 FL=1